MKKILALVMICAVLLGLCACSANNEETTAAPTTAAVETTEPTVAVETEAPTETEAPAEAPEAAYEEQAVSVDSSTGDYQISAVLTTPNTDEKVPLVVMLHGFGGTKEEGNGFVYIARTLAKNGIASIRMDFAGTGEDTRDFTAYTLDSAAADAEDCVAYAIANANVDETRLGLFGYSNGGRIGTQIIGLNPEKYQARVFLAPAVMGDTTSDEAALAECNEEGYRPIEWYGRTLNVSKEYYESTIRFAENLETYEQVSIPTLVIRGTNDTMVVAEVVDPFVEITGANLLMIPGADHGYGFYSADEVSFITMDTIAGATAAFFHQNLTDDNAAAMFGNQ